MFPVISHKNFNRLTCLALFLALCSSTNALAIGFNAGLTIIVFLLISRILAEYPYPIERPGLLLGYFGKYWEIALSGLLYNAAIWIDKWVMWFSPHREVLSSRMFSSPDYDSGVSTRPSCIPKQAAMRRLSSKRPWRISTSS